MAQFNPQTNRVINGICEYCGIKADNCEHYKNSAKPLDVKDQLALSEGAPAMPSIHVEPLTDTEKAKSVADAKAAADSFRAQVAADQHVGPLNEPENTKL